MLCILKDFFKSKTMIVAMVFIIGIFYIGADANKTMQSGIDNSQVNLQDSN